jgi:hypothetical protein
MSDTNQEIIQLKKRIFALEAQRDDLIARLPAHSIPPAMIAELDEIDEQLSQARTQMAALGEHNNMI